MKQPKEPTNPIQRTFNGNQIPDDGIINLEKYEHMQTFDETVKMSFAKESESLFTHDDELTVANYNISINPELIQRKRRYIEYFKRHYGTL
jgi:hypothetical protein